MAKRKPKTLAKLINEAATLLQKLRRMQESDDNGMCVCVSCGRVNHYKMMDGGHFIPRQFRKWKLDPRNINPQCKCCNGPMQGNITAYTLYMIDKHGRDFVDNMESTKRDGEKPYRNDVLGLIEEYKLAVKQEEQRIA